MIKNLRSKLRGGATPDCTPWIPGCPPMPMAPLPDRDEILKELRAGSVYWCDYLTPEMKNDKKFMISVLKIRGAAIYYLQDSRLIDDPEVVLTALNQNPNALDTLGKQRYNHALRRDHMFGDEIKSNLIPEFKEIIAMTGPGSFDLRKKKINELIKSNQLTKTTLNSPLSVMAVQKRVLNARSTPSADAYAREYEQVLGSL